MKHPLRASALAVAATLAFLGLASFSQSTTPSASAATVEPQQALEAARHGAEWIALLQEPNGELSSFGGDWALSALAATGVNAADVRLAPGEPSAQDYYLSLWTGPGGPGGTATDYERAILAAYAGGLQPSRLDAHTNLVADLAARFDGHDLGETGSTNADAFGILALAVSGVPSEVLSVLAQSLREQQDADGGWNFAAGGKTSEADITGAAIAALCATGATPEDPALARALAYLHTVQDEASGGFVNSSPALGLNTDTTSWVVSGLRACSIDPNSWVTAQGTTPLDFLVSQQNPDGSFQRRAHDEEEDFYATQDAVRALAGASFTAPSPRRSESGEPAVRPAPTVTAGTLVPMTLVIDAGGNVTGGSSIRMCKVTAPVGATVAQVLKAAEEASSPAYCVSDLSLEGGRIARLNGVTGVRGSTGWMVGREGVGLEASTDGAVGLGALVQVRLVAVGEEPPVSPPASTTPTSTADTTAKPVIVDAPIKHSASGVLAYARLKVHVGALTHVRHGHVKMTLSCPATVGAKGCSGRVRVRIALRPSRGGPVHPHVVGEREVHLTAGTSRAVAVALSDAALRALRARGDRVAWIVTALRDGGSGTFTSTAASTVLR